MGVYLFLKGVLLLFGFEVVGEVVVIVDDVIGLDFGV